MNIAKSFIVLALAACASIANAQSFPHNESVTVQSAWILYKPINRVANKQLFESHYLQASHRNVASPAYPAPAMTKAVHRAQRQAGNVPSSGYPTWTISKAIHRK
ncbi:MAG TPA: hypothetical protein VKZ86_09780 [Cyclobacteriaceae bacterium]|nr:hypothetical protein [Cyclobacteriaceae bacterium]